MMTTCSIAIATSRPIGLGPGPLPVALNIDPGGLGMCDLGHSPPPPNAPSARAGQRVAIMLTLELPYLRCIFLPAGNRALEPPSREGYNQSGILLQIRCRLQ